MAKKLKIKKGQSKYMPHLRVAKPARGRVSSGIGHIATGGKTEVINNIRESTVTNEHGIVRTKDELATKGKYGGLCNRSCCLSREAYWYNRGSYAYYCETCARLINAEFRHRDDVENYGSLLVKPPADVDVVDLSLSDQEHEKPWAIQHADGTLVYAHTESEACHMQRHFRYVAGLRSDGSEPLWYKDLSEKYEYLRTLVTVKADR